MAKIPKWILAIYDAGNGRSMGKPRCNLQYMPTTPRERKLRVVMSKSFGVGGHNASIIAGAPV